MRQLASGFNPDSARLWIVVYHVFVATVTLVMDYVSHRDDSQAAERKREIMNCYRLLEGVQEESVIARRGLRHLKGVMRDWMAKGERQGEKGAVFRVGEASRSPVAPNEPLRGFIHLTQPPNIGTHPSTNGRLAEIPGFSENTNWMGFGVVQDLWQDPFDFNSMSDDPQWEVLFRDLESQLGIYS